LRRAEPFGQLTLREPGSPPGFPDQIAGPHARNIADTL
jgi:hypothetical protein